MVKSPRIRHSKSRKKPVTIDLETEPVASGSSESKQQGVEPEAVVDKQAKEQPATEEVAVKKSESVDAEHDASPEPEQAAPEPKAIKPPGRPSLVLSGLIGAVIALLAAGGLQWAGLFPAPSMPQQPAAVIDTAATDALQSQLTDLSESVDQLKAAEPAPAGIDEQRLQAALDEIDKRITGLKSAPVVTGDIDMTVFDTVNGRIDALEATLQSVDEKAIAAQSAVEGMSGSSAAIADRMAAVETAIEELDRKSTVSAGQPRVARAIAAAALKSAIDRGDPFMTELETYASVAQGGEEVAALRDLAASGVPTEADIADLFEKAAGAMISASRPVPEDAGVVERLISSARSLVEVRPVGQVAGDDAPAIIARMEVALKAGKLPDLVTEYEKLPEAVRTAGGDLIAKVRARMQANDLVDKTLSSALTGVKE